MCIRDRIRVERAGLQTSNKSSQQPDEPKAWFVEIPLEPRSDLTAILDGLHEVLRLRVKIDRQFFGRAIQLREDAPKRFGKSCRCIFHAWRLSKTSAAPRFADATFPVDSRRHHHQRH